MNMNYWNHVETILAEWLWILVPGVILTERCASEQVWMISSTFTFPIFPNVLSCLGSTGFLQPVSGHTMFMRFHRKYPQIITSVENICIWNVVVAGWIYEIKLTSSQVLSLTWSKQLRKNQLNRCCHKRYCSLRNAMDIMFPIYIGHRREPS